MNDEEISLHNPSLDNKEIYAVKKVLQSKKIERNSVTKTLEFNLSNRFCSKYSILVSNGTAGLIAALYGCGIKKGDEVITTPFSFIATTNAILFLEAIPVYVDIEPDTYNINTDLIEPNITPKTKAILSVDLYGLAANYSKLHAISKKYGIYFISDSCQSFGSKNKNKFVTQFADISVFSFFISKNIVAGEGGLVMTNSKKLADNVNLFINHGQRRGKKYHYMSCGVNFRPTDIQAAILNEQILKLEKIIAKRRINADLLIKKLSGIKELYLPNIRDRESHVFSRFTIKIKKNPYVTRKKFIEILRKKNIETEIAYPQPLYSYKHVKKFIPKTPKLKVVSGVSKQVVSLPVHQNLTKKQINKIVLSVAELFKK